MDMSDTCAFREPYCCCCSSTGGKSEKNFGDSGEAIMLRHLKEKDDRLLSRAQRGFRIFTERFRRFRHRKKTITATRIKMAPPPAAIPAMAAVLSAGVVFALFSVDGSTTEMRVLEKTEPLRPSRSVAFGFWRQPASRATRAICYQPTVEYVFEEPRNALFAR